MSQVKKQLGQCQSNTINFIENQSKQASPNSLSDEENELKTYAHRTINELLSLYGYERVQESDIGKICPKAQKSENHNTEKMSEEEKALIDDNTMSPLRTLFSATRSSCSSPTPTGQVSVGLNKRAPSPVHTKRSSVTDKETEHNTCVWCRKAGPTAFTLTENKERRSFCSEKCFTASRRANFKKSKHIYARSENDIQESIDNSLPSSGANNSICDSPSIIMDLTTCAKSKCPTALLGTCKNVLKNCVNDKQTHNHCINEQCASNEQSFRNINANHVSNSRCNFRYNPIKKLESKVAFVDDVLGQRPIAIHSNKLKIHSNIHCKSSHSLPCTQSDKEASAEPHINYDNKTVLQQQFLNNWPSLQKPEISLTEEFKLSCEKANIDVASFILGVLASSDECYKINSATTPLPSKLIDNARYMTDIFSLNANTTESQSKTNSHYLGAKTSEALNCKDEERGAVEVKRTASRLEKNNENKTRDQTSLHLTSLPMLLLPFPVPIPIIVPISSPASSIKVSEFAPMNETQLFQQQQNTACKGDKLKTKDQVVVSFTQQACTSTLSSQPPCFQRERSLDQNVDTSAHSYSNHPREKQNINDKLPMNVCQNCTSNDTNKSTEIAMDLSQKSPQHFTARFLRKRYIASDTVKDKTSEKFCSISNQTLPIKIAKLD